MPRDETRPSRRHLMTVFAGLMLGTFVSSLNLTLVAPALPTIVAQLGGLEYYSWIPLSSLLASTVIVPVAGKLSDLYGRKPCSARSARRSAWRSWARC